jgi:hypothetical protein
MIRYRAFLPRSFDLQRIPKKTVSTIASLSIAHETTRYESRHPNYLHQHPTNTMPSRKYHSLEKSINDFIAHAKGFGKFERKVNDSNTKESYSKSEGVNNSNSGGGGGGGKKPDGKMPEQDPNVLLLSATVATILMTIMLLDLKSTNSK